MANNLRKKKIHSIISTAFITEVESYHGFSDDLGIMKFTMTDLYLRIYPEYDAWYLNRSTDHDDPNRTSASIIFIPITWSLYDYVNRSDLRVQSKMKYFVEPHE